MLTYGLKEPVIDLILKVLFNFYIYFRSMDLMSIDLFGKPFVQCFAFSDAKRISREMRGEACLMLIKQGHQEFYSPLNRYKISSNESFLMKCGNFVYDNPNKKQLTEGLVFHLSPESIDKAFNNKASDILDTPTRIEGLNSAVKIEQNDLLVAFSNSLLPYFENKNLVSEELMAIKMQELVNILISQGGEKVKYLLSTILKREEHKFDEIINSNLYNNLSIPELAHLSNKSESSFKREFNRLYSKSPAKYIKTKKLEKAAQLLVNSDMSVSEISWECGFEDLAHFSSSFSNAHQLSPRKFRAFNRNQSHHMTEF